ncbi:hypothetical protein GCM10017653_25290 [Ancylobacter defluvii]|uniref:Uncharacterized protein n=1 Tax=Ancylobacter defluvii TaxID=1282440 RepID=A0A9W6NAH4_9HYPH|nr:hypothetical protein [Ancylobacter defluvii]GLK84459.1 hypothetical protein GCM10017653_25290 [Ancylobacter defluvii]
MGRPGIRINENLDHQRHAEKRQRRKATAEPDDEQHREEALGMRATVTVSKRHEERGAFPYWYAYHPERDEYLGATEHGFVVFGCMDKELGIAILRDILRFQLPSLNTTVRRDSGKMHWHIHPVERDGQLALLLPKSESILDLTPYLLKMDIGVAESSKEPAE